MPVLSFSFDWDLFLYAIWVLVVYENQVSPADKVAFIFARLLADS